MNTVVFLCFSLEQGDESCNKGGRLLATKMERVGDLIVDAKPRSF